MPVESYVEYSLWSRGRLLGHSKLDYKRCMPRLRTGDLAPTAVGESLMHVVTGVRQAWIDAMHVAVREESVARPENFVRTTEFADVSAAQSRFDALDLELRDPQGTVIPTDDIHVLDTEVWPPPRYDDLPFPDPILAETPEEKQLFLDMEHDAALLEESFGELWDDEGEDRPWEVAPVFARYQLYVTLKDDALIPPGFDECISW
ncbi:MAG: hypothetical protein ACRENU_11220 [Gemmatimonadaceae bacterium]